MNFLLTAKSSKKERVYQNLRSKMAQHFLVFTLSITVSETLAAWVCSAFKPVLEYCNGMKAGI